MSDPIAQDTLRGFFLHEKVGYISRNEVGYICEIVQVINHNVYMDHTEIQLALPNGATVLTDDSKIHKIPNASSDY